MTTLLLSCVSHAESSDSLTALLHKAVLQAPSGLPAKVIAEHVGREYRTLMSELSSQPGHKLGADLVLPLMQATGSFEALDVMAAALGKVCVSLPAMATEDAMQLNAKCLQAVSDFGRLMESTAAALEDGTVTRQERATVAVRGYEALAAIVCLLKAIDNAAK